MYSSLSPRYSSLATLKWDESLSAKQFLSFHLWKSWLEKNKLWWLCLLVPNRDKIFIISAPSLQAGIGSFQTFGTKLLKQMVTIARPSSTPSPNFMLVMSVLDGLWQALLVPTGFALHPLNQQHSKDRAKTGTNTWLSKTSLSRKQKQGYYNTNWKLNTCLTAFLI